MTPVHEFRRQDVVSVGARREIMTSLIKKTRLGGNRLEFTARVQSEKQIEILFKSST